jgi:hypothetical protein
MTTNHGIEHFVAQSYLRRFAVPGSKQRYVYALDKSTGKVISTKIRKAAAEWNFFGKELDDYYSDFDDQQPKWIDDLIECVDQNISIPLELRGAISYMLSIQAHRTNESRRVLCNLTKSNPMETEALKRVGPERYHWYHAFDFQRIRHFADIINECAWCFVKNETTEPFITSDNPVLIEGEHTTPDVLFPLSHKLLLFARNEKARNHLYDPTDQHNLLIANCWQVQNCGRFAYSPLNSFQAIQTFFLEKYPQYKDMNRDRTKE